MAQYSALASVYNWHLMLPNSPARRFSLKEVLLLLLPCLLLAAFALAMRNRGGNTLILNQPFALTMEKYELEPVTPLEVSHGYSAKLKVTLNHVGSTPAWWGKPSDDSGSGGGAILVYRNGKYSRAALLPPDFKWQTSILYWHPRYDQNSDRYIGHFLIPLVKIPARKADVVLLSNVAIHDRNQKRLCQPIHIEAVLRKAGEPVKIPRVSTDSQLAVKRIQVVKSRPITGDTDGIDTEIRVLLRYTGAIDNADEKLNKIALGPIKIMNANADHSGLTAMQFGAFPNFNHPDAPYTRTLTTGISLAAFPKKLGALFYEAEYSYNNGWPLRVRIPLREANGRDLLTKNTLAP